MEDYKITEVLGDIILAVCGIVGLNYFFSKATELVLSIGIAISERL